MDETKEKLFKKEEEEELIQNQQNGFHSPLENFGQENGHLIEYRTLSTQSDGSEENVGDENNLIQIINPEGEDKEEVERDIATSVDLSDQSLIRQALGKMQNFVDDIQINQLEIIKVLDEAKDKLIIERTQICSAEMERILGLCKRRKGDLQKLLEQCRLWEQLRASLELWLNQANEKLTSGGRVIGLSDDELSEQLDLINQLTAESDQWEEKLREMNRISNQLLEIYRRDDGHNLSHLNSKLNTQWAKFNDQLRIRRSVIEAAQRSRFDFQTALGHFQQWMQIQCLKLQKLANETENQQKLKDTGLRNEWLGKEKSANMEIDAHREMMESVKKMGRKLLEEQRQELLNLDNNNEIIISNVGTEREILLKRVESIESEWNALLSLHKIIKERLENAQEECDRLIQSLSDFLFWVDQQRKTISNTQPVGGDLNTVERQCGILRTIQRGIEAREQPVEECIKLAHEFLMQHNLRPPIHHPSLMAQPPVDPYSPKTEAEREERRVGQQINSDSKQLQEDWAILKEELTICYQKVADTHKEMQELDRSMAEALLSIGTVEGEIQTMRPVENLLLEDLNLEKVECLDFRQRVHEAGTHVDDVNNWASSIQAMGIELSDQLEHHIIAINERYEKLKRDIGCRWAALERALNDFGPASENFLVDLVEPPWQRAISTTNRLPYYIDHSAEHTQWDHPAMVDILESLCSFNQVKFSAYRTAMKLRALQKRLCLDLIDLADLNMQYTKHLSNYADEKRIQVEDVIQCLLPLFEKAHEERPALVPNVSLAVDLTLNLLLNIFDPCRDAKMRVLSFKIALVVLCHATLEAKYTYLFHLISNKDGVDHKRLAVLFYDLIHIPKFLGEAAAFGGSNIEPSVRSCFEHSKFPPHINSDQFLDWLKREPQSLVWLPVMHRLASSEFAKHQAKCNACKMFPIVGLRYRCLRCFNFDICQNCFFSQRIAKSHKLNHPMQEYCTPTSTGDDVRDFTAIIKNKVRQGKGRIGYLPVEQINEGPPLECAEQTPQNSETESIHQRMHLIASRLEKRQIEAAEHFPLAVILPSDVKINGVEKNGIMGVGMHTPIMIDNEKNEKENELINGNKQQNEISQKLPAIPGLAPNFQSPEIQIYHDQQRNAQISAVVLAAQQEVKSPSQLVTQVDQASKEELGQLLQKLQYENIELKRKIEERRKAIYSTNNFSHQATTSTPNLRTPVNNEDLEKIETDSQQKQINIEDAHKIRAKSIGTVGLPTIFSQQTMLPPPRIQRPFPVPALHRQYSLGIQTSDPITEQTNDHLQQMTVLVEAQKLRLHQKRLEERGMVLEEQNKQLQQQLDRLQKLMEKKNEIILTPTQKRIDEVQTGIVSSTDAEDTDMEMLGINRKSVGGGLSSGQIGTEIRRNRMDRLRETVNELNKAMEHFVQFTQHCSAVSGTTAALRRDIENQNGDDNEEENDELDSGTADQDCFEEKKD
ncbi:unnamed protein product [Meloidogyne enterolobii]|uniref:Uncharacterized protein n=3 Tax=Meloidogyne enterolobii TaxID=390850 RepID=A0ACB1ABY1_MELEN